MVRLVKKHGCRWVCRPRMKGGWHCGYCGRGVLTRAQKSCLVCHAKVMKRWPS